MNTQCSPSLVSSITLCVALAAGLCGCPKPIAGVASAPKRNVKAPRKPAKPGTLPKVPKAAPAAPVDVVTAFVRWRNEPTGANFEANARAQLSLYLAKHRRIPPGLSPDEVQRLVVSGKMPLLNQLKAANAAFVEQTPSASTAGGKMESAALLELFSRLEANVVSRKSRSALILELSSIENADRGKDRADNAERRARRRMALYALRKIDGRMMPKLIDPYASPKPLQTKVTPAGKTIVYSIGPNAKDDGGDLTKDIVLPFL